MPRYSSSKTWGHDVGLSCAFRQWRAESHCRLLHGYALAVSLRFDADRLDHRNWVVDFGGLKPIKGWLCETFDHKLLVAQDDPERDVLQGLHDAGLADVLVVPATGCEAFARLIFDHVTAWLRQEDPEGRVRLAEVEVREHGANSATARPE